MSELFDRRKLFSSLIPKLLNKMIEDGYTPLIGKDGLTHMKNSLHYDGLAMDIDLFKDNVYLITTEAHLSFGEFWESLSPETRWGGRFRDGNHYSVTYKGKK
jgi:hypothetical protein